MIFSADSDKPSEVEGFPQREWWIEVYLVNDKGELVPANIFDKVIYHLHPSFDTRAVQSKSSWYPASTGRYNRSLHQRDVSRFERTVANRTRLSAFKNPPFRIQEEGWGEFDMQIELVADKSHFINHDLNFAQERYESKHVLVRR